MADTSNPPVATLAGVTLPGQARPVSHDRLRETVSVLRKSGGNWQRVAPQPGMRIHAGDVIHLKADEFRALGARAFTVDGSFAGGPPPTHLDLMPHEASHVVQQVPTVTPLNDAEVEVLERAAKLAEEDMVLHRQPGTP